MPSNFPLVFFASGERVLAQSYRIIHEKGIEFYELTMGLTENTLKKYKITDDRLDTNNPEFPRGLLTRRYIATDFIFLSNSPEDPLWFVACNFDGTAIDMKGTKLAWLVEMKDNLLAARMENVRLRSENEDLKQELHMIVSQLAKWYKRKGILFDTSDKVSDMMAKALSMSKKMM
jgi:hypothetical protein